MRVLLDTNVVVSGLFFGGTPRALLEAWTQGAYELVLTPQVVSEYLEVCERLGVRNPNLQYQPALTRIIGGAALVADPGAEGDISRDPDDDKFFRAAKAEEAIVVSGDADLLEMNGWEGVQVLAPSDFMTLVSSSS